MSTPNATTPAAPAAAAAPAEGTPPAAAAPAAGGEAKSTALAAKPSVFAKEVPAETPPAQKPAEVAPVELDLPEGFDAKAGESLKTLAGKLGLDKTKGAELVKAYAEANAAAQKQVEERFNTQVAEWKAAAKADPAIEKLGGFDKVVRGADRVLTRFDSEGKLGELLEGSGLAFHPAVVSFFGSLAAALKEDTVTGAAAVAPPAASQTAEIARLKALYPKSPQLFAHLKE